MVAHQPPWINFFQQRVQRVCIMSKSLRKQGLLPLKRDFEPKVLTTVKHTREVRNQDSFTEKTCVNLPVYPTDGTSFCLVYVSIQCFTNSAHLMNWNTDGPKLFEKFKTVLEDPSEWETIVRRGNTVAALLLPSRPYYADPSLATIGGDTSSSSVMLKSP
jgi:hypothetical protein